MFDGHFPQPKPGLHDEHGRFGEPKPVLYVVHGRSGEPETALYDVHGHAGEPKTALTRRALSLRAARNHPIRRAGRFPEAGKWHISVINN